MLAWLQAWRSSKFRREEFGYNSYTKEQFHKQLNAWKIRNSWSHSLARQESWHVSLIIVLRLVNQVGLVRGWTLVSFWLERSKGGCDHLFCSGCHCTSCTSCCTSKKKKKWKPGPRQNHKVRAALILPHFFFNLPSSSSHSSLSGAQWPQIAQTHDCNGPQSQPVETEPCATVIFALHPQVHWNCSFLFPALSKLPAGNLS